MRAFSPCWSFPAKPRFRGFRALFTSPCCAFSAPPTPPSAACCGNRPPAFRLCDTRKDFPELREARVKYAKHPPRILFFTEGSRIDDLWSRPVAVPPPPSDGMVSATRLNRRLQALKAALDDLPRQAKRLAR
ncbi:MAG: hypothetical protein ABL936_15075, partial [Aestuariivirga sp.]